MHLDGVYDRGADGALRFFRAPPSTEDVERLVVEIGEACEAWLSKQGYAGEAEDRLRPGFAGRKGWIAGQDRLADGGPEGVG